MGRDIKQAFIRSEMCTIDCVGFADQRFISLMDTSSCQVNLTNLVSKLS